jgi:CubicO group peptidase (beta-lactamase class C family)
MKNTLALSKDISSATNRASAHTVDGNELKKIPYGNIDNLAPAGSISSSVNDLSHWLIAQLDNGKYNGVQAISSEAINVTRFPHSILGNGGSMYNTGHFALYGLGWFLREYNGKKIVEHTGGVNGFVTAVTLVPEAKLGIVVLTNTDANNFYEALKAEIMDAYLDLPYRNYSARFLGFADADKLENEKELKSKRDTIAMNLKTDLPLTAFAGNYTDPIYGKMSLAVENGKLVARFEHHKGRYATLSSLGGSRFFAEFNEALYGKKVWPFRIENGAVKSVTVTVADFVEFTPYEFQRN